MERDYDEGRTGPGRQLELDTGSPRPDAERPHEARTSGGGTEGPPDRIDRSPPRYAREPEAPRTEGTRYVGGERPPLDDSVPERPFSRRETDLPRKSAFEPPTARAPSYEPDTLSAEQETGATTDELRYEGPIRFEDEPMDAPYSEAGSGRTLFTTALIGGAVILIIGVALYLRDEPLGVGVAGLDEPPAAEGEAGPGSVLLGENTSFGDDPALGTADTTAPVGVDEAGLRPLPAAGAVIEGAQRPAEPAAIAEARPIAEAPPRPTPRPAATRQAPVAPPDPAPVAPAALDSAAVASLAAGLGELVGAGRLDEAARMARERAQFAPGGSWTLQVLFACQGATVSNAFREDANDSLLLFPVERSETSCYRLTWGVFPSRDAALAQASYVPAHFRRSERPLPIALSRAAGL